MSRLVYLKIFNAWAFAQSSKAGTEAIRRSSLPGNAGVVDRHTPPTPRWSRFGKLTWRQLDLEHHYDVVMCTLFLHHLDRETALNVISKMYRATRRIVLIDDLRRTWLGYRLAQLGCQLLTRSHMCMSMAR